MNNRILTAVLALSLVLNVIGVWGAYTAYRDHKQVEINRQNVMTLACFLQQLTGSPGDACPQ